MSSNVVFLQQIITVFIINATLFYSYVTVTDTVTEPDVIEQDEFTSFSYYSTLLLAVIYSNVGGKYSMFI